MKRTRRFLSGGFTLTEILIVVVIVGVMAATVMPKLTSQPGKAATAEAIGIMTAIHRALLRTADEAGVRAENFTYAELANVAAIKASAMGIDFTASASGWTLFYVGTDGRVTARNMDSGRLGKLSLCIDGTWGGTGAYDPTSGGMWPHLPTTTCTPPANNPA